jgi:glutamate-ammonia-ligase adenylyltransferase
MARSKVPAGPLDLKLLRGGLVDCEFIVHFLQLREGLEPAPALDVAIAALVARSLLDPSFADAQRLMARVQVVARLLAPDGDWPAPAARPALARAAGETDCAALQLALAEARRIVASAWARIFEQELETD